MCRPIRVGHVLPFILYLFRIAVPSHFFFFFSSLTTSEIIPNLKRLKKKLFENAMFIFLGGNVERSVNFQLMMGALLPVGFRLRKMRWEK